MFGAGGEEGKGGGVGLGTAASEGEQAEFVTAMYAGKERFTVFKIEQTGQLSLFYQIGEEELIGGVGGNAGRNDDASPSAGAEQLRTRSANTE